MECLGLVFVNKNSRNMMASAMKTQNNDAYLSLIIFC